MSLQMSGKISATKKKTVTVTAKDPSLHEGKLKVIGGSKSDDWTMCLRTQPSTPFASSNQAKRRGAGSSMPRFPAWSASARRRVDRALKQDGLDHRCTIENGA
jgi:hypothetical protein